MLAAGVCALAGLVWVGSRATLSATEPPGRIEMWAAARAKTWLIGRAARVAPPFARPTGRAVAAGAMRFRGECAPCHGTDGRSLSDIGRGMYPRAVDLGSPAVQAWSDRELFWIIKHGIRLTGMPGFDAALEDDEIRALVAYVRTLPDTPAPSGDGSAGAEPRSRP